MDSQQYQEQLNSPLWKARRLPILEPMTINEEAIKLLASGLSVIPIIMPGKNPGIPSWKDYQDRLPKPGELEYTQGVGVICGAVSGGLECLDIDLKYDLFAEDTDMNLVARLRDAVGVEFWDEIEAIVTTQRTVNGGYHLLYRCSEVANNLKLAMRYTTEEERMVHKNEKTKVLIETRGGGGYFAAFPTPGYQIVRGSLEHIGTLTPSQRNRLLQGARLLNDVFDSPREPSEKKMMEATGGLKPWEDFVKKVDIPTVLTAHGWTYVRKNSKEEFWKRPGSTDSIWSGTYWPERNNFYVFTSSVAELQPNHAYNSWQLTVFLEYGGDFSHAAKEIIKKGFGERSKYQQNGHQLPSTTEIDQFEAGEFCDNGDVSETEVQAFSEGMAKFEEEQKKTAKEETYTLDQIREIWKDVIVNEEPPKEVVLLEMNGTPVATAGNHSLIVGLKKSRKSLYITLLLNAYKGDIEKDVILFDTEQGRHHVWQMRVKVNKMTQKLVPIFYLRGKTLKERCDIIEYTLKYWPTRVKIIVIDGIRDLMSNINDPDQTTELIYWLERMTLEHNIHIINVLHLNKTDSKPRGHLGSELLNKAEMTTELKKDEMTGHTQVSCESSRGMPFEEFYFTHGPDGLPELRDAPVKEGVLAQSDVDRRITAIFEDGPLRYKECCDRTQDHFEIGEKRAKGMIAGWVREGIVMKSGKDRSPNTMYSLVSLTGRHFTPLPESARVPEIDDDEVPF